MLTSIPFGARYVPSKIIIPQDFQNAKVLFKNIYKKLSRKSETYNTFKKEEDKWLRTSPEWHPGFFGDNMRSNNKNLQMKMSIYRQDLINLIEKHPLLLKEVNYNQAFMNAIGITVYGAEERLLGKNGWKNRQRKSDQDEKRKKQKLNSKPQSSSSTPSNVLFEKMLSVFENHGSSAIARIVNTKSPKAHGKQKTSSNDTIDLYHVATQQKAPLNLKNVNNVGEFNGKTWWHSDPNFKWTGRADRTNMETPILYKTKISRKELQRSRSTKNHDTNVGTTFALNSFKFKVKDKRKMNRNGYLELNISPL